MWMEPAFNQDIINVQTYDSRLFSKVYLYSFRYIKSATASKVY